MLPWIWIIPLQLSCFLKWQCVWWTHLLMWAFDSSYVFFFSASFFFALIASTWHCLQEHSNLFQSVCQIEPTSEPNEKSRTRLVHFSPTQKKKATIWLQEFWRHAACTAEFELMEFLSESSDWLLKSWQPCLVPLDPRCSYTLQGNGLRLVPSNLLLSTFGHEFSALPGLGLRQRYTLNISERKKNCLAIKNRSNTFLILKFNFSVNAIQKAPRYLLEPCSSKIILPQ